MKNKGTIFDAAYYMLNNIGQTTPMNLQRLCYYAQAWSLAWDNNNLFEEDFEAWPSGPVCPELYNIFNLTKDFSVNPEMIKPYISEHCFSEDEKETLNVIIKEYGDKEPYWMSELVRHEEPWLRARGGLPLKAASDVVIPKKMMLEYYSSPR